ncbi:chemotaxis protein CheW [Bermanella marisrubri]|uniref:Chemotaxis signal transduction protein n=1 Tax=Bermanella marisrubri TaxID=207949 RepID=Q1MZ08_9GAMM|nr:chemotaxis protein CheW [Bermanella marisrubri]EAT11220.1 Chemotaxis signal transduction protein [Oceanobacter sp. RED65] [Bermanella marisrubri]QIZ85645.1 chemotaxis protein CheW [Bermanella marisrubri]
MTPFALLQDIAQRCRSHAADLPSRTEAVEYWRGVGFVLSGRRFVAPMNDITEILTAPKLTQVPGVKHWVEGVANVRGRLVPVMDLATFLSEPHGTQRNKRTLIIEKGELLNGLVVDAVLGMQHFPVDSMESPDRAELTEKITPFIEGVFERNGEQWPVFSFEALSKDEHYMDIAV